MQRGDLGVAAWPRGLLRERMNASSPHRETQASQAGAGAHPAAPRPDAPNGAGRAGEAAPLALGAAGGPSGAEGAPPDKSAAAQHAAEATAALEAATAAAVADAEARAAAAKQAAAAQCGPMYCGAPFPGNEWQRLSYLRSLGILDTVRPRVAAAARGSGGGGSWRRRECADSVGSEPTRASRRVGASAARCTVCARSLARPTAARLIAMATNPLPWQTANPSTPKHTAARTRRRAAAPNAPPRPQEAEERFDSITRLCGTMFDVPISLVSLVDAGRQWFKSEQGLGGVRQTDRTSSFCAW